MTNSTATVQTVAVAPHAFDHLPKGASLLGGPEAKFTGEYVPAKLTKDTKAARYVRAILEAGHDGATITAIAEATGVKASNLGSYPSFDVRNGLQVRVAKLATGNLIIVARKGVYTAQAIVKAAFPQG